MTQEKLLVISPTQIHQTEIIFNPEQLHYLRRVLRLQPGDSFIAMNGEGNQWLATLTVESGEITATLQTEIRHQTELPVDVILMAALPKGNGFDEVVRQVTELGVTEIRPILSERTLLKPSDNRVKRWRRIATEAAEQSERQRVPAIFEPISLTQGWCQVITALGEIKPVTYICVARGEFPHLLNCLGEGRQQWIANGKPAKPRLLIAVGPEGGWTSGEVEGAIGCGFQPVSLGARILRAVTVPGVILSWVMGVWEQSSLQKL